MICPTAKMYFIEGNHEDRMRKALLKNVKIVYGLRRVDDLDGYPVMSLPNLLAFDTLDINYLGEYPSGHIWLNENMYVGHGEVTRGKSGATVNSVMNEATHSEVFGHIHRNEITSKTLHHRDEIKTIVVGSFGTMTRIDDQGPPSSKARNNWQQGFGFVDFTNGGYVSLNPVFVHQGRAAFEGEMYVAANRSITEALVEETGWNF